MFSLLLPSHNLHHVVSMFSFQGTSEPIAQWNSLLRLRIILSCSLDEILYITLFLSLQLSDGFCKEFFLIFSSCFFFIQFSRYDFLNSFWNSKFNIQFAWILKFKLQKFIHYSLFFKPFGNWKLKIESYLKFKFQYSIWIEYWNLSFCKETQKSYLENWIKKKKARWEEKTSITESVFKRNL